jgi:hypothetical protein
MVGAFGGVGGVGGRDGLGVFSEERRFPLGVGGIRCRATSSFEVPATSGTSDTNARRTCCESIDQACRRRRDYGKRCSCRGVKAAGREAFASWNPCANWIKLDR